MSPRTLFRTLAFAEAVTWTLLLLGLVLKYVTGTTELGVRIGGGIHGFVFLCYAAVAAFTWVNQKWSAGTGLLAIVSAVVPYATVPVEKRLDRSGLLDGGWRLAEGGEAPKSLPEAVQAWVLRKPWLALGIALAGVAAVFSFLLFTSPADTCFA